MDKKPKRTKKLADIKVGGQPPAPAADPPQLNVLAGFGFRASLNDDELLQIEQDDIEGNTDTVVLSRSEVRQFFDTFWHWSR